MKFSPTAAVVAFLAIGSSTALAQDAIVQGSGYQVSENAVVHPSIGAQTGFDSNVFYEDSSAVGAGVFRLVGGLALEPMEDGSGKGGTPPDYTFSAGARFAYQEFLSSNDNVVAQRNLGLGADLLLGIKPASEFPITIEDHFIRTNRPTNFESNSTIGRDINTFKAGIAYVPEGRNISGRLHYSNTIDFFEGNGSAFARRLLNKLTLGVDWQFLPITRFFVEGSYGLNGGLGSNSSKVSSSPARGILGVASAITEAITVRAHAGYGFGSYSAGASYSSYIYHLEGGYRYSPVGRVRLIFDRDFQDSINANFYADYKLKLAVDQQVDRVILQASVAGILRTYSGVPAIVGPVSTRDDVIVAAEISAGFELRDWIALNASYDLQLVQTDFVAATDGEADDPSFVRHQVLVGATAAF
tara:strand:+ start:31020 stop:32261 length:1242 start_codon:yes stop_codon:yes gene_type:complete